MSLLDSVDALGELVLSNLDKLLFSVVAVIVGCIFYKACMHFLSSSISFKTCIVSSKIFSSLASSKTFFSSFLLTTYLSL